MSQPEIYWTGKSKKTYGYWSKLLPFSCKPGEDGNYILTKPISGEWIPIYIGQGDLNDRVNDPTHSSCAERKGATHVHVHTEANEQTRLDEESDLLAGHPVAYAPTGCNQ